MANWFRQVEGFLETVDRTAANVAVIRDKQYAEKRKSPKNVDDQLAALEPSGVRLKPKEKISPAKSITPSRDGSSSDQKTGPQQKDYPVSSSPQIPIPHTAEFFNVDNHLSTENLTTALKTEASNDHPVGEEPQEVSNPIPASAAENGSNGNLESEEEGISEPKQEAEPKFDTLKAENGKVQEGMMEVSLEETAEAQPNPSEPEEIEDPGIPKSTSVQRELDEAKGLLRSATSIGQSKEARLARVCASLSQRLQEYKAENKQLEQLLTAERSGRGSMDVSVKSLEQQLAMAHAELTAVEASSAASLVAKNAELAAVSQALTEANRKAATLEGQLASAQANVEAMSKTRDMTEERIIQALREELRATESRYEQEKLAHASARQSHADREQELEQQLSANVAGLSRMQRIVEERSARIVDLEDKVSVLETECASLSQELSAMDSKSRKESKRGFEAESAQVATWREEAERAKHFQREAEDKIHSLETENQRLKVELESRKRISDSAAGMALAELEKRFRDLTEVLYLKQSQLESVSSERQALALQLEKEERRNRELKAQSERDLAKRRSSAVSDEDDTELKSFESLGLHQRHIVGPQIQEAAKLLDRGTVTAGRFLWRRPLARLGVLFYLVFVHLFLMHVLHRLQEQADEFLSRDRASIAAEAAAGLVKPIHKHFRMY